MLDDSMTLKHGGGGVLGWVSLSRVGPGGRAKRQKASFSGWKPESSMVATSAGFGHCFGGLGSLCFHEPGFRKRAINVSPANVIFLNIAPPPLFLLKHVCESRIARGSMSILRAICCCSKVGAPPTTQGRGTGHHIRIAWGWRGRVIRFRIAVLLSSCITGPAWVPLYGRKIDYW